MQVTLATYKEYIKAGGGFVSFFLLTILCILAQVITLATHISIFITTHAYYYECVCWIHVWSV